MANPLETTFKNLQTDERYKKLARSLKVALLKNAEKRSNNGSNTGTWPNVSNITGEHFDTSLAAMSIQSSRVGSEVVSSSTNFRNIVPHKQHLSSPINRVATSSENQFPTNKDNDDSAMMPPPQTPGIDFGLSKRLSRENQRVPLLNMPVNSATNTTNGFSVSTSASSISSIPNCVGSNSVNSSAVFQETNNYGSNEYDKSTVNNAQKQERNFARWRVLLNDKAQLIIKGILECGKVARSKPVIRRLSPTRVQSVFKHTYRLQGNLVDDRGELPDYVRGKFYNGFPDDWENVYQLWQNFVNDGSRLSFHWPTNITDSDDDIKSGITEITYRPERYRKSTSPRKRNRSANPSKLDLSAEHNENHPDGLCCSHRATDRGASPENSVVENNFSPRKLLLSHSKNNRQENPRKADGTLEEKQKSHDFTTTSIDSKNSANSLAGYIPEDKLNIIIDNLTNKNCPIEYIRKIVQMFDCMKYLASYPSLVKEFENEALISNEKESSKTTINKDRSSDEKNSTANTSNSNNRDNTPQPSIPKVNQPANQLLPSKSCFITNEKSYNDSDRHTRRQLTSRSYESSESDDDFCDDTRKTLSHKFPAPETIRKTQQYKNPPDLLPSRQYIAPEILPNVMRKKYCGTLVTRNQSHDSSISDDEFVVEIMRETKLNKNKSILSPRKTGNAKENRTTINHYDSSISITQDEECRTEKPKLKDMRKDNYDSSVSITEDEHANVRNTINAKNYYCEINARALEPEIRRYGNSRDDRKKNDVNFYSETKSHSRNGNNSGRKRLDCLDYYSNKNSRHAEQNVSRNGNTRDGKNNDFLDYYCEKNSRYAEQNSNRNGDIWDSRNRNDSSDYYSNSHSHLSEQDMRKSGDISEDKKPQESLKHEVKSPLKLQGTLVSNNLNHLVNEEKNDSAFLSSEAKRSKKLIANRELINSQSSTTCTINRLGQQEFENPKTHGISPSKNKTSQVRKKPMVVSTEKVEINLTVHDWKEINCRKASDNNTGNSPIKCVDGQKGDVNFNALNNDPISDKSSDLAEPIKIWETVKSNTRFREANSYLKVQKIRSLTTDKNNENIENPKVSQEYKPAADYGTQQNPKLLTAWVPAVICDDNVNKKYHLIFEGKLLNEAGHVANRKFVTDIIRRRLSPRIIETITHEFYKLDGDLNDTKHVVPKELIKLCHNGCPAKIGNFCERWKSLTEVNYKTKPTNQPQGRTHNTSVDCLGVPMSSRGRRILPPLNYWAGERVVTKDNKTMYSPGIFQEGSIPSSFENSTQEERNKKNSPEVRAETKRTNETKVSETKKKNMEQISTRNKYVENPQQARESRKTRTAKRRLTKNVQLYSSESDDGAETKPPRKRKSSMNDNKVVNTDNVVTRKLRNSIKNSSSPQTIEDAKPHRGSFEKSPDSEAKVKLRKRPKIDENQGNLQRFLTKKMPEVKCMFYKNVPIHDGDLSEDQLSTM